jgi:cytochrome c oxidase subunit III
MGSVVALRPHAKQEFTSSLGMIVFLGSWGMMFAGLFFAYGFLRSGAPSWPPPGVPRLPVALPALNTAVLLASSAALARGVRGLARGRRKALTAWVGVTLAMGVAFLALQITVWRSVAEGGLHVTTGLYGSVFYALTVFHALHVAAGLLVLLWVFARSLGGAYSEHSLVNVRLCSMFWHFVDAVWVLMFVSIYLV